MSTERQIATNRVNFRIHRTAHRLRKSRLSRDAATHHLTAKGLIILPDAFAQIESDLRASLIPNSPLQEIIFKRAVQSAWNLERCRFAGFKLHSVLGLPNVVPLLDENHEAQNTPIQKYSREAENCLYKALREIARLQEEARYRQETFPLTPVQPQNAELFARRPCPI